MIEPVLTAARLLTTTPREERWAHLSLCVLDAVFSIGARYRTTVRTCRTYARHAGIEALDRGDGPIGTEAEQPLDALLAAMQDVGDDRFAAEVLVNRQRTSPRGGVLKAEAARRYAETLVQAGVHRYADVEALLGDADRLAALEEELRRIPGNGSGDVRLGYLWMLVGHDRMIKPDRMVLRWLERVLDRPVSVAEARTLLEAAALELGCTPWELDHAVWNAERGARPVVDSDTKARRRHRAQQGRWREEVLGMPSGEVDSMLPEEHGDAKLLELGRRLRPRAHPRGESGRRRRRGGPPVAQHAVEPAARVQHRRRVARAPGRGARRAVVAHRHAAHRVRPHR